MDAEKTVFEALQEAEELSKDPIDKTKIRYKRIFDNAATVISLLAIGMTIALYSYNSGYYKVFNIPVACIPLDLKSYIPITIQFLMIIHILIYYISFWKTDIALEKNSINPLRLFYSYLFSFFCCFKIISNTYLEMFGVLLFQFYWLFLLKLLLFSCGSRNKIEVFPKRHTK